MKKVDIILQEAINSMEQFNANAFEKLDLALQNELLEMIENTSKLTNEEAQILMNKEFFKNTSNITIQFPNKNGKIINYNFNKLMASEFQNATKQLALDTTLANMEEYDLDLVEFSTHDNARPSCAKSQGKVYSMSNWSGRVLDYDGSTKKVYPINESTYGEVAGIMGINCRHQMYPYTYDNKL